MRALAVALISACLCRGEWIRVETPGIELFTDAGERSGRAAIGRFEQIRSIFLQAGISNAPLRLRVFLFDSTNEFHLYHPRTDGFYYPGADRDYIAFHTGPESGRVAFHEYVHMVLRHSAVALPKWFDEGFSEFYSTAEMDRNRLKIGAPIDSHVALLASEHRLNAAQLSAGSSDSAFYAESWALVHMLNLGPRWRDGMPRFILALVAEKPPEQAFREAFGHTLAEALAELPAYLKTIRPVALPAFSEAPRPVTAAKISADDAAIARAGLALNLKHPELAASLLEKLGETAQAEAMRGSVALARDCRDEARRHLDRAIQLGNRDAALYFEYAMLERESGRPDAELLGKVIAIDPGFGDALFLLGVRETDDGNLRDAIEHLAPRFAFSRKNRRGGTRSAMRRRRRETSPRRVNPRAARWRPRKTIRK